MKIGVYNQNADNVLGGAEYFVVVVADTLSRLGHDVELIHHKSGLTVRDLERSYGLAGHHINLRYADFSPNGTSLNNPVKRYRHERARNAGLSDPYDLFVASVHDIPPFCHAATGALIVHFPYFDRRVEWPWADDGRGLRKRVRRKYAEWEWKKRFENYQVALVNSEFTRSYTKQWWGIDSDVVYAPAETRFSRGAKEQVLSVGRFSTGGTSKRQLELMTAFRELSRSIPVEWEYCVVGGLSDLPSDIKYFNKVKGIADECGGKLIPNIDHQLLKGLYERSKIFWHGAGFGDENVDPVLLEHFGIVTVEAMAAGAVPVVFAQGGQPEIVEHEKSGFLWTTLKELQDYTKLLMADDNLLEHMSLAARERSEFFSREMFDRRLTKALGNLIMR